MKVLFSVVKNEQLLRTSKASNDPSSADKLDPSKPFYELYKQVYFEFPWTDKEITIVGFLCASSFLYTITSGELICMQTVGCNVMKV